MIRVLLATPYSPIGRHDHAAADLARPLVSELSRRVELFVYSPGQSAAPRSCEGEPEFLAGIGAGTAWDRHLGSRPAWLRREWSRAATAEVLSHSRRLRPDILHCEYLQAAEPVLARRYASVVTLHDDTTEVQRRLLATSSGTRRLYRRAELVRTGRFERRVLAAASVVVALSQRDATHFRTYTDDVLVTHPGVVVPDMSWTGRAPGGPVSVLFFGAMWRAANIAIARFLVRQVLPLIWAQRPEVTFCVAGSRPPAEVHHLADGEARIRVTGFVEDLDALVARSTLVLAPNLIGGGVQLKVLRSLAVGCPVVTSADAAEAVGAESDVHLLVGSDPGSMAQHVVRLVANPALAARIGAAGRDLVARHFEWAGVADRYLMAYERALAIPTASLRRPTST